MRRLLIVLPLIFVPIGCQTKESLEEENNSPRLVHYESDEERNLRLGNRDNSIRKYFESDEKGIGEYGTERNIFKTDEALEVSQALAKREDVRQAQVATSPTQIVAFVILKDFQNPNVAKSIEEEIQNISPHKDIYIYTDQLHYNRVEDLKSSMRARQIGDDLERFFEEFLNIKIKD